jgi:hypothetical protein
MKLARRALFASVAVSLVVSAVAVTASAADKGKAEAKLKAALRAEDSKQITEACDELEEVGGKEGLDVVLGYVKQVEGQTYWQLIGGAAGFRDKAGLEYLGDWIVKASNDSGAKKGLARDLTFGLQNNSSLYVPLAFAKILEKGAFDVQLVAADQLGQIRAVESIDALVKALLKEAKGDANLKGRIEAALRNLTGENQGDPSNWELWWKNNRDKGVPEKKSGSGGAGGTMEKPNEGGIVTLEKAAPKRVIVLAATGDEPAEDQKAEVNDFDYDTMQAVLTTYKIPHVVVKRKSFDADPAKYLKDCYALLINCHQINKQCVCPNCQPPEGDKANRMMHCNHKCNVHIEKTYALSQAALDAIKNWVENEGGFLYTEDWGLVETTGKIWPNLVTAGDSKGGPKLVRKAKEKPEVGWYEHIPVKLQPAPGSTTNPLMRGVWQKPKKAEPIKVDPHAPPVTAEKPAESLSKPLEHMWTVDDESPQIDIKDPGTVIPLLQAEDLTKVGDGFSKFVAVTFRVGGGTPKPEKPRQATGGGAGGDKPVVDRGTGEWSAKAKGGRVLHTMSHFGHQGGGTDDGQALFNLIINFLQEAEKRHGVGAGDDSK